MHQRTTRSATAAALFALALTACGGGGEQEESPAEETAAEAAEATAADGFGITDPWIKAVTQDEGMTGVFGEITNGSESEMTIVAAAADGADTVQLHEGTLEGADASMSEMAGGFVVPAGGTYALEPGGNHIMLMELTRELAAGDSLTVTVEFEDGSTTTFDAAIRPYTGANENYGDMEDGDGGDMDGMEGMDGDHEGHGDGSDTGGDGGGSGDGYGDE